MRFATDWTLAFVVDVVVGWALAGLAIGAIVKKGRRESAAELA